MPAEPTNHFESKELMMNIPDSMPTLSYGPHDKDSGRACVMEYVSLLAGEEWTDLPSCTHPALGFAAQNVNDALGDADRHLLIPLIGRLFGTREPVDFEPWLRSFVAIGSMTERGRTRADVSWRWGVNSATEYIAANAANGPGFLSAMLDEYDRLSGRPQHRELTPDDLADLAQKVSA